MCAASRAEPRAAAGGSSTPFATLARSTRRVPPLVLAITGILFFQAGGALATHLFPYVEPGGAALMRLGFGATILCLLAPPRWSALEARHMRVAIPFGLSLGVMNLCFYEAVDRIPFGTAITIQFIGPLAVGLLARRRRLDLLWVLLAAIGILALVSPTAGSGDDPLGYLFAACAGAGWGLYIFLAVRLGNVFEDTTGLAIGMLFGCLVPLGPALFSVPDMTFTIWVIPLGIAVALLSSVIPHALDVEALRRLPPNAFGILMSLEPAIALLTGAILLSQTPTLRQGVGVLAVVIAAVGVMRNMPTVETGDHI